MRFRRALLVASIAAVPFQSVGAQQVSGESRARARNQLEFGIDMARHGLWNEAAFWFERATQVDPEYAAAFNNLAIAYEQLGRLDEARTIYDAAVALDPDNPHIVENRTRFVEIDDRRERPLAGPTDAGTAAP